MIIRCDYMQILSHRIGRKHFLVFKYNSNIELDSDKIFMSLQYANINGYIVNGSVTNLSESRIVTGKYISLTILR